MCPGPAIVGLGGGRAASAVLVPAMLGGMVAYELVFGSGLFHHHYRSPHGSRRASNVAVHADAAAAAAGAAAGKSGARTPSPVPMAGRRSSVGLTKPPQVPRSQEERPRRVSPAPLRKGAPADCATGLLDGSDSDSDALLVAPPAVLTPHARRAVPSGSPMPSRLPSPPSDATAPGSSNAVDVTDVAGFGGGGGGAVAPSSASATSASTSGSEDEEGSARSGRDSAVATGADASAAGGGTAVRRLLRPTFSGGGGGSGFVAVGGVVA
jgi:hypothetical protein